MVLSYVTVPKPITDDVTTASQPGAFSAATHVCVVLVLVHVQIRTRVLEVIFGSPSQTRRNLYIRYSRKRGGVCRPRQIIFNVMFIDLADCLRPIIQQRVLNSSHLHAGISED